MKISHSMVIKMSRWMLLVSTSALEPCVLLTQRVQTGNCWPRSKIVVRSGTGRHSKGSHESRFPRDLQLLLPIPGLVSSEIQRHPQYLKCSANQIQMKYIRVHSAATLRAPLRQVLHRAPQFRLRNSAWSCNNRLVATRRLLSLTYPWVTLISQPLVFN